MGISKEDFQDLEDLARLNISDEEQSKYMKDFENILSYVEQLKEVDTEGVEPLIQVSGISNVFRPDEKIESIGSEAALSNTNHKEGSSFKVPAVID